MRAAAQPNAAMTSQPIDFLARHPTLAVTLILALGIGLGLMAIIAIGIVSDRLTFGRLGYRVRRLTKDEYVYEEQSLEAPIRNTSPWREVAESMGLIRPRRIEGTRHFVFQCERDDVGGAQVPSEAHWNDEMGPWAQGRRAEIVGRIADYLRTR